MKKKYLLAVVAGAISTLVVAAAPAVAQEKPANVLRVLWRGVTNWEKPFETHLAELGVKANFTDLSGDQDRSVLAARLREIEGDIAAKKFDAIYSFGTTATQMTQSIVRDRTPIVFNIVFDPVDAKLVQSMDKPGGNTTGVTNGVPIEDQFDVFNKLAPIKSMAVLFNAREANSNTIEGRVTEWAKKSGVTVQSIRVAPGSDALAKALDDISSGRIVVDAIYAGADSYLGSQSGTIQKAVGDKVRLYGGTATFVENGWLGAYTPSAEGMGRAAAELVVKVLNGADAGTLPVVLPKPLLFISKASADKHGVTPPADAVVVK